MKRALSLSWFLIPLAACSGDPEPRCVVYGMTLDVDGADKRFGLVTEGFVSDGDTWNVAWRQTSAENIISMTLPEDVAEGEYSVSDDDVSFELSWSEGMYQAEGDDSFSYTIDRWEGAGGEAEGVVSGTVSGDTGVPEQLGGSFCSPIAG